MQPIVRRGSDHREMKRLEREIADLEEKLHVY